MPYEIHQGGSDCPFEVVKQGTGERVACHNTEEDAKQHMAALYANVVAAQQRERNAPVEWRSAEVAGVNEAERIVTVIAVPYEQRTKIPFDDGRGVEIWDEMFLRGSFVGIEGKKHLSVNREHNKGRTVGRVVNYFPDRREGLVIDAYIADTDLGEETWRLARRQCLFGSVGFAARRTDQIIDRRTKTRSIKRAFLDHLAFVPDPAYEGAEVIGVRSSDPEPVRYEAIPGVDDWFNDPLTQWMNDRLESRANKQPYGPASEAHYADPGYQKDGVKRYPLSSAEKCRAAWSYINQADNADKYTAEQLATIKGRIKAAAKRFGITIAD